MIDNPKGNTMRLPNILIAFVAGLAAHGAVAAHAYEQYPDRAAQSDWYTHRDRCDYARPWVHERKHKHHARVGGAGPCHEIHRGEHLPRYYWSDRYRVADWRRHHLSAPWGGHHWVQTGNDFVLVDAGSGRIAKVVLMRHRRR
jgi:Ni/Co efflux regulator RcnB